MKQPFRRLPCSRAGPPCCCPRSWPAPAVRLRLQRVPGQGRGHQGRLGRSGQPVPAPRRPDPEPGQHRQGLCLARKETLEAVTRARAAATSFQITPEVLNNPEAFQKFQQVQGELSGALSRLMAVSENYPNLKADTQFRDLQSQLEGTENRITVARQRYIASVQDYNVLARSFPTNLTAKMFGYRPSLRSRSRTRKRSRPRRRSTSASKRTF
jgi:hypothetical protein